MGLASGILLVLDEKSLSGGPATPFSRIWCDFEISMTVQHFGSEFLLDIATCKNGNGELLTQGLTPEEQEQDENVGAKIQREVSFPIEVIRAGLNVRIQDGKASREEDRVHILNSIVGMTQAELNAPPCAESPYYEAINVKLRTKFALACWVQAVDRNMVEALGLPAIIAASDMRDMLFSYDVCSKDVDDGDLITLSSALPDGLQTLTLNVSGRKSITSVGFVAIGSKIPKHLQVLNLSMANCVGVKADGIQALMKGVAGRPVELDIDVSGCDCSIAALATCLPSSVTKLCIQVGKSEWGGDSFFTTLATQLPALSALQSLTIVCPRNKHISHVGLGKLAKGLPDSLMELVLDYRWTALTGGRGARSGVSIHLRGQQDVMAWKAKTRASTRWSLRSLFKRS